MKRKLLTLLLVVAMAKSAMSQSSGINNRSLLTIMVVPYTFGNDDIQTRMERDSGYKNAISVINSALIDMGYSQTLDFKTYKEVIDQRHLVDGGKSWSDKINIYIENAPVDIIVETEITWIDPPGNPRDRQAKLRLKAIDKYTGAIYADNGSIHSSQREFPDLGVAVESTLQRDGRIEFKKYLDQLDSSYANLMRSGRQVGVRFGISAANSGLKFSDTLSEETLSDKIEEYIRGKAFHGQYRLVGESATSMDFKVIIPVIDENGVPQTPSWFLNRQLKTYFRRWGLDVDYAVVGNWVNFTLLRRTR